MVSKGRHTVGNVHRRQARAAFEGAKGDARHRARNRKRRQTRAIVEGILADTLQPFRQVNGSQRIAAGESVVADCVHRRLEGDRAYAVFIGMGFDGGAEAVGIGQVEQLTVRGGIVEGLEADEGGIGVEVRLPAEGGTLDGDGLVRVFEFGHGSVLRREGDGESSGKGDREDDDAIVDILLEGSAGSRGQGDLLEAVHDGRLRGAVHESEGDVAGDVFPVVALEGDGGDVAAGQAEPDAAADVEEFQGIRGGMGQGDEQVVIERFRHAALRPGKGRRDGSAVTDGIPVVRIQAPDIVRFAFCHLGAFVGRAENGVRGILRILGDIAEAFRPEKHVDLVVRRPQDGADPVLVERDRGTGFLAGFDLGEDFGQAGAFFRKRRILLRFFLAGSEDKGQRQAGKHSCFHSASPLKQIFFIDRFVVIVPAGKEERRIIPESNRSHQRSVVLAA